MKLWPNNERARSRAPRTGGSSVVEILIASSIAVLVLSALMVLFLEAAKEQSRSVVEAQLHQEVGLLQDRLTRLLHEMSATESTIFGDPLTSGSPFYRRIIVAHGKPPAFPREEIVYDPQTMTLTYDPNRSQNGDETMLFDGTSPIKLRNVQFFPSMKPGGLPDSTSINVWLELDDDGAAGRRDEHGAAQRTSVMRTFVVTMRNQ